jgi:post-segregation antitoxin (ccd killing protein)
MSESRITNSQAGERRSPSRIDELTWQASAVGGDGAALGAYSEEAFRYLLAIERKRAERSGRPFFLLLVDLKRMATGAQAMDVEVAAGVFAGLSNALRDTDFTGWYREGRIAGAVLAQLADVNGDNIDDVVRQRVRLELSSRLSFDVADRLQTRVFQIPRAFRS